MKRYRVKFVDDALRVDAYAETFGGTWTTSVDGWAFLRVPDDAVEAVEEEFERDDNVIEFVEMTEAEDWKMLHGKQGLNRPRGQGGQDMDGMIPVGDEQEQPVRARRRSVWIVARAWRGCVVEVALRPTQATAHRLASAWLRVYNDEGETDVAVFRRVLPKED